MELLERIRLIANKDYISDLSRDCLLDFYQLHKLKQIDSQCYSLIEWNEAVKYISNKNIVFDNIEDAKNYICNILSK